MKTVSIPLSSWDHIDTVAHKVYSAYLIENEIYIAPPYYLLPWNIKPKEWYEFIWSASNDKDTHEFYFNSNPLTSHHMKTYIIPIKFQFNGTIEVQAESLDEANATIEKNMHATINIENDQYNQPTDYRSITDYNIDLKWYLVFLPMTMDNLNIPS